ncbi:hypothetical protein BU23DRAFT_105849 [Bimuria novae-zelandiae CBS 107.79]|uniref:Uncharacterized protein n=1 Tax=Bimuria novae-zelandiae CBS 107.79 TaxID=1447943 RepID=A0A6A5VT58_9PLEO|nr:hypothetical protein BU23DRAFT_105849 [Bimuria novae-zelandiae CBS 107.79]
MRRGNGIVGVMEEELSGVGCATNNTTRKGGSLRVFLTCALQAVLACRHHLPVPEPCFEVCPANDLLSFVSSFFTSKPHLHMQHDARRPLSHGYEAWKESWKESLGPAEGPPDPRARRPSVHHSKIRLGRERLDQAGYNNKESSFSAQIIHHNQLQHRRHPHT